jgi:REP element-mobilizing transposase RayT
MPRIARIVVEGLPHHITQPGNGRQVVFDDARDRLNTSYLIEVKCVCGH